MASTASSELKKAAYLHGISHEFFREPPLIILRLFHERLIYSLVVFLSDLSVYLIPPPFFSFLIIYSFIILFCIFQNFQAKFLCHMYIGFGTDIMYGALRSQQKRVGFFYFILFDLI